MAAADDRLINAAWFRSAMTRTADGTLRWREDDVVERVHLLGTHAMLGRTSGRGRANAAILTADSWRRQFGRSRRWEPTDTTPLFRLRALTRRAPQSSSVAAWL
jgi:hypothetical protein